MEKEQCLPGRRGRRSGKGIPVWRDSASEGTEAGNCISWVRGAIPGVLLESVPEAVAREGGRAGCGGGTEGTGIGGLSAVREPAGGRREDQAPWPRDAC